MKPMLLALSMALLMIAPVQAQITKTKPVAPPKPSRAIVGIYEAALPISGGITMRMIFRFDGTGKLLIDSPEEGLKDLKPKTVTILGDAVTVTGPGAPWTFRGVFSTDHTTLSGTFTQGSSTQRMTFKKVAQVAMPSRPQTPKPPFPYTQRDVVVPNPKAAGVTLAGTLTVPMGAGPFPAAVFITGSGPQDRDESILGHKPFAVIADELARHGIASLRCDDRGTARSTGNFKAATSADFATDSEAIVAFLKTQKEVDPAKIGLIGHSEGGLIAPMLAAKPENAIAFVVLLAGPGVSGDQVIIEQAVLVSKAMGQPETLLPFIRKQQTALVEAAKSEIDPEKAMAKMGEALGMKIVPPAVKAQLAPFTTPWFHYFLTYDPTPALTKLRCPVLALNGTNDLQVPATQNLPAIEKALKEGGNTAVTIAALDGLNHLFQHSKTGAPSEYAKIEETFSPDALKQLREWIVNHTK